MRAFVYFNLHRMCWSVKALSGPNRGRVIAHANYVRISDATFRVSEAGRQRVIREKRKNVHAGVVGTLAYTDDVPWDDDCPSVSDFRQVAVTYNPHKAATFVDRATGAPVTTAEQVTMSTRGREVVAWVR